MILDEQPGHIDKIKQVNAGVVYRLIDEFGPISRIELSKRAQLAPASITKIVRELVEAHLVKEAEFQDTGSRGRPAIGLILETETWHYLSGRIDRDSITLALRDLSGKLVKEEQRTLLVEVSVPLLNRIIDEIDHFFIRHQKILERLTAIAITMPGTIDYQSGVVHKIPFYDIHEMPLGPALKQHTGLPIFLQNDICAWTIAEVHYGASKGNQNVIQVVIDHHISAGVITSGRLIRRSAVEIGHTQVDPYAKRCYCGNNGCLEAIANIDNILEVTQQRLNRSLSSLLCNFPLTVESLCEAALAGDVLAKDIILEVGNNVGRILSIMVNLFNPEIILVGSPLNRAASILHPALFACIHQQALPAYSANLQIAPTQLDSQSTMPGAALIKEALYNGTLLIQLLQG